MSLRLLPASLLALLAASPALADTVDVTSTTALSTGRQPRAGDSVTTATAYELATLSARDLSTPFADDVRLFVSIWGSYDFGSKRTWDNRTLYDFTGDVLTGYAEGRFFHRRVTLRLGRTVIAAGGGQALQLDGGEVVAAAPYGLRFEVYAGAPVAQRFTSRSSVQSWNPLGGDFAYGGRLGYSFVLAGPSARGFDVGLFANRVQDGGERVREEVGADYRVQPFSTRAIQLVGFGSFSPYEGRMSQASAALTWSVRPQLQLDADWRFTAPDLLLSRTSILSVFSASEWHEAGIGASWDVSPDYTLSGNARALLEPGQDGADAGHLGHDLSARVTYGSASATAGFEATWLNAIDNGYLGGRLFGRRELGKLLFSVDVGAEYFRVQVRGKDASVSGNVSAGLNLGRGLDAVLTARAGLTPYLDQTWGVLAKLTYTPFQHRSEVR
jgi:hypothetical protein